MQICLFLNWVGGLHAICEHVKYDDISELCQTAQFAHYRQTTFGQFQNLCHVSYVVCAMLLKELSPIVMKEKINYFLTQTTFENSKPILKI